MNFIRLETDFARLDIDFACLDIDFARLDIDFARLDIGFARLDINFARLETDLGRLDFNKLHRNACFSVFYAKVKRITNFCDPTRVPGTNKFVHFIVTVRV